MRPLAPRRRGGAPFAPALPALPALSALPVLLAGCEPGPVAAPESVDIVNAARMAQERVDRYAAETAGHRSAATPPAPAGPGDPPAGVPARISAHYRCRGLPPVTAAFDNRAGIVTIASGAGRSATLAVQRAASGIRYRGDGWELRGKGTEAVLTAPDGIAHACVARD